MNADVIGPAVVAASALVWLGMVLGISFLEAPLKFRAPGVTHQVGIGIGRLVFRALNAVELALAAALVAVMAWGHQGAPAALVGILAVLLVVQVGGVRPVLNRRSDRVLAGEQPPRSRAHLAYVAIEVVKVGLLVAVGVGALAALAG